MLKGRLLLHSDSFLGCEKNAALLIRFIIGLNLTQWELTPQGASAKQRSIAEKKLTRDQSTNHIRTEKYSWQINLSHVTLFLQFTARLS